MQLRKLNVTGTAYYNVFVMKDGTEKRVNETKAQHEAFAQKNARLPTKQNGTWVRSYSAPMYDSDSGDLEQGCYAQLNEDSCIVNIEGKRISVISAQEIKDDVLNDDFISKIEDKWQ